MSSQSHCHINTTITTYKITNDNSILLQQLNSVLSATIRSDVQS